jgi:hypothetical protein
VKPLKDIDKFWLALVAAVTVAVAASAAQARASSVAWTEVSVFSPPVPKGSPRVGECWTDSIAIARVGAWRCMVGNEIFDPCFEVPGLGQGVVCGASPVGSQPGFVLKLSKPLPKPTPWTPESPRAWLIRVSDGSVCEIETGTIAHVDNIDIPYACSDSKPCDDHGNCPYLTGLAEDLKQGRVWTAEKIVYSAANGVMKLIKRERVALEALWQ